MVAFPTTFAAAVRPDEPGTVTTTCLDLRGTWLIALEGEHDRSTLALLDRRTRGVWRRCRLVIVDLSAARFIDSAVIDWLLRTRRTLLSTGHSGLRVVPGAPDSAASRLFGLMSAELRDVLACHDTVAEAIAASGHRAPGTRGRPRPVVALKRPPTVFDRLEARAWVLAVWIVRDVQVADEIVVAAYSQTDAATGPFGEAGLLCHVRRLALAVAPEPRPAIDSPAETVRAAILDLPDGQREAVELSLFGGLSIDALAAVTASARAVVVDRLVDAMRVLRPVLGRRALGATELAAVANAPPLRLTPPERWPGTRNRSETRRPAPRRVRTSS
jgi:ABC-type transporter Mla MlaB component